MMHGFRLFRHIESDHLTIPALQAMLGQDAEITIRPRSSDALPAETLETFLGSSLDPVPGPEEMAQLRAPAERDPGVAAAVWLSERAGLDIGAILEMRNAEGLSALSLFDEASA
jgi:hypothetical protein